MPQNDLRLALAQKRLQALEQLHQLVCRQAELVEQGDLDELLRLLQGPKQRVLLAWGQIEKRWQAAAREDCPWTDSQQQRLYQNQVRQGQQLLERIVALEMQCEQRMQSRREELGRQIQQIHHSHQVAQAYAQGPQPSPSGQLDLLSDA